MLTSHPLLPFWLTTFFCLFGLPHFFLRVSAVTSLIMDNCTWPKKKAFWLTATVLSCLSHVSAAPVRPQENDSNYGPSALQARDTSIPLRILGVGASIMAGWGSANYNGGRKPLRDALRADGWDVDMVGSLTCGDMVDNVCSLPENMDIKHHANKLS